MCHKGLKNLVLLLSLLIGLSAFGQTTLWQYNSPEPLVFDPTVGPNLYVYFATTDGMLRALDPNGQPTWTSKPGGVAITPIAMAEDRLYFGTSTADLKCYGTDGNLVWTLKLPVNVSGPLAVTGERKICFATGDGYLYCVEGIGGGIIWKKKLGYVTGPPSIGADGTIYAASENFLHAVTQSGNIKWRVNCFNFSDVPIALDSHDNLYYIRLGIMDVYDKFGNYVWEAQECTGARIEMERRAPVFYGDTAIFVVEGGGDFIGININNWIQCDPAENGITPIQWWYSKPCDPEWSNSAVSPSIMGIPAVDASGNAMWCDKSGLIVYFDVECGELQYWHPTVEGYSCTNVILAGRKTGGLIVVASGQGKRSIQAVTHSTTEWPNWDGPAGGPWSQWLGTPTHLQRRDDAPLLHLSRPFQDEVVTTSLQVLAEANDDFDLKSLEIYINDNLVDKTTSDSIVWGTDAATFADGDYKVSAVARDYAGNQAKSEVDVHVETPVPVYGLYSAPPLFSWVSNSTDTKYQLNISPDSSFYYVLVSSAKEGRSFKKMLSWQPTKKKWNKVLKYAAAQSSDQTVFYWRVVGKYGGEVVTKTFIIDRTK